MSTYKIAILAGDGIGPEIMAEGIKVLKVIEARNDVTFNLVEAPFGASAWFTHGSSFPEETKKLVDEADMLTSKQGTPGFIQRRDIVSIECHCSLFRQVDTADQVEQGGLA